ncbi:MAG: chemotaxis protein CheW [Candidatus Melainabacteria bacterium]|jgi:purine-binding chemotaxis protein CheW|nr:chemotaxis protein CheW [Candidatus Melainabacteria bacterium]
MPIDQDVPLALLIFWLDDNRYAVPLENIDRVHPAVEIMKSHESAEFLGFVNVHGEVIPVINVRNRFNLPSRELTLHDMLVVAKEGEQKLAFFVDGVDGVLRYQKDELVVADSMLYASSKVKLVKFEDGLVILNELRDYLSEEAKKWLAK